MSTLKFYITLSFLWLSHFLVDLMIGIWPIYKTIAGLDIAIMGMIAAGSVFIGEALQLYFGILSDRGYRKTLIISGILATCACALIAYTENYTLLFLLFLTTCIGSGAFHPSAISLMGSLSENRKGLLITLFSMGGSLGFALSQIAFTKFYLNFDGQTAYLTIPSLLMALLLVFFSFPENKFNQKRLNLNFKTVAALFKKEHLPTLYFTQICNQIIGWGTIFLLPDILCSRGYDTWICHGGGHLFLVLGSALMMVPMGYLADKFSYKKLITICKFLGCIAFITFLKFPFTSNILLLICLFFMGGFILVINPLIIAFGNKLYPKEPGTISGFLMGFAWFIANPLGQAGGGLLTKLFTEDKAANALSILGIFFVIGFIISLKLPETQKQPETSVAV